MDTVKIFWNVIFFFIVFLIVYVFTYYFNFRKIKKRKGKTIVEYHYLISKFHLNQEKVNYRKMLLSISLIDAFIIATVTTCISIVEISIFWQICIGFILLIFLIYICYEIYGHYLIKKGWKKEGKKK